MNMERNQHVIHNLTAFLYLSILLSPFLPPVALGLLSCATIYYVRGNWELRSWPEVVFLGFMLVIIISWCYNPTWYHLKDQDITFPIGIVPLATFGAYYMLSMWTRKVLNYSWRDLQKVYLLFWLSGLYVAAIVFLQQLDWYGLHATWVGDLLDFYRTNRYQSERSIRSIGTTGNSNLTAALLICFALLSIYASSVLEGKWKKTLAFSMFFLFCTAIAYTGSRGAWIGLVIGLIVQVWMTGQRKWTVGLFAAFVGVVSFFPSIIPRKDTLATTIDDRFQVWSTSWEIFQDNWLLGALPIHFGQLYKQITGKIIYHAHNVVLGIASEYGVIGLLLFSALIFMTIRRARAWRKAANQKGEKRLAGMLISQTVALLGHGMYDYPIISPQVGLLFMLSVVMIHTQYERRCVIRPNWRDDEEAADKLKAASYPATHLSAVLSIRKVDKNDS
ncbi:O-antigen ligase [Thermoactinomyces sp. DSM 45891]|nr:O-antigen ligase [Thermoactinomyces sp. DSM 45891]